MSTSSGGGKQFPLNTKGCCFICLKLIGGKAGSTSLVDLCKYLEIDMKQVYQKSLSSKNLPTSTAAEEFEKAETRGQLCPKCSQLIVESVDCYRQLELIEIKRKSCLKAIIECFKKENSKLAEFRRMMTSDKFATPYLAIVTELRKQIGIKCFSQVGGCATPKKTSHSVRQGHQASRISDVKASNATPRNIQIKESQLITVPTALPTQTFTEEVSDGGIEILEAPKEEVKEEVISSSPPPIEIADEDIKEEIKRQVASVADPLEPEEPAPLFSITAPPLTTSVVSTTSGIPCKLCKTQVICTSFQDLRQHYSSFHPKVKLATKCNLCGKFFEGQHDNCQGGTKKKKSASVARARQFLQSQQSLKRKKVALETAQAPSQLKAKRKRKSSPKPKPPKRERSEKKKRPSKVKAEALTPKRKKGKHVENDSSRPPVKRQVKCNWEGIDPSQYEALPDSKVKCLVCAKTYIRKEFRRHFYSVHLKILVTPRRKYACDMCDVKFSQKRLIERHKQVIHFGIGSYQRQRQRTFNWKNIDPSQFEVLPDSTLKCTICTEIFIRSKFRRHFYSRHVKAERKIHACDICDDKFTLKSYLERHKQVIHLGIGSYLRVRHGFVNVWDPTRKTLQRGTGKRWRLPCKFGCGKIFSFYQERQLHYDKVHLGVTYLCDFCGKYFANEKCLKGHKISIHGEGGEEFACDVCGKRYPSTAKLLVHKRSMHEGLTFTCQVPGCTTTVKWKCNLIHHMKKFHPDYSTKKNNDEPSKA